ncbi:MAG TPA: polyribonucleotide nucleotidyltransferase [Planctomycetota bacterium]|jgi:polyribonucleotide nucleotidyltransferase|nr:polyribonucleotide nucleotidyltransferase [Planctomycetota bacterium]HJM39578.1 polyribonucleotide nucleotidyltransferase [Planctomycetota bacterium]|tara:strand:+ start:12110 stop:14377 length:2268 start_codon:yes stop_codon:yes gene_type:complete
MTLSKNPKVVSVSREIGGRTLTLETGWIAKQANGCVIATYGETSVMTAVVDGGPRDLPFFPLTVDYREKTYAAGQIPGNFFRREGRPSTKEVLAMRVTDRSVRPMFIDGYKNEVQIMSQVLSYDQENEPDSLSMVASFAALHISNIPFLGPMGAVRLGYFDGNVVINPTHSVLNAPENKLDMTLAATSDAVCMVEAGANELPEAGVLEALRAGHDVCRALCEMCEELREKTGSIAKVEIVAPEKDEETPAKVLETIGRDRFEEVLLTKGKHERYEAVDAIVAEAIASLAPEGDDEDALAEQSKVKKATKAVLNDVERNMTLNGKRVDGRDTKTIRPIDIETRFLPRTHGSALFTRGETQAIVVSTLGSSDDEQIVDDLHEGDHKNNFMLHYNFPPYCVGEARPIRGTSRREYGHGALAERALRVVLPDYADFPYTIRIVSDITESNGSSSMASVCGGCLSMLDAGVPLKAPVAGIAMGLIKDGDQYAILSDILGSEDHHGDMDFKVTGTEEGITAIQMDIKVQGLSDAIMEEALEQAREGRMHILGKMAEALTGPAEMSPYAPVNKGTRINPEKIGFLIGPKGANIKKLQEDYGVTVSVVNDEGDIQVSGTPLKQVEACLATIIEQLRDVMPGERYNAKVTSIKPFGCFADIGGGKEGMCHISELAQGRVEEVEDVCKEGDTLEFIVVNVDQNGKIRLSRRIAELPEEEVAAAIEEAQASAGRGGGGRGGGGRDRGGRGGRGGDRGGRSRERSRS